LIITRWLAPLSPNQENAQKLLKSEGLDPFIENYTPQQKVAEHKHPFCEVRMVIEGELLFNVSGNQFLLRSGDKVEIPANTRHAHIAQGSTPCLCVCAQKIV